jgi:abequosyltransferase
MPFRLSFCIPTFNFGAYIGETLDSIVSQATDQVQIVIVDGGSTDDTAEIVGRYMRVSENIKFIRRDRRHGIDLDILETVAQADGEYCWLLSSDDVLRPDAVQRVLNILHGADHDLVMVGFDSCTVDMSRIERHPISRFTKPISLNLSKPSDRLNYFSQACTTTAFFSFISNLIVRRKKWQDISVETVFIGSCWIIASKLFSACEADLRLYFDPSIFLDKRGDNDSFSASGVVNRLKLSICGFRELGRFYFGSDSIEYREIDRVLRNEYTFLTMLYFKLLVARSREPRDMVEFMSLVDSHWKLSASRVRLQANAIRMAPACALAYFYACYRLFRRTI